MEPDFLETARSLVLAHPWVVVAVVAILIVLLRGFMLRRRAAPREPYRGAPRDGSEVADSAPIVARARRQMILVLIALAVVAILVIMQNLH